jgi:dienelactone hydrolase
MLRIARCTLAAVPIALALGGCEGSNHPLSVRPAEPTMSADVVAPTALEPRTVLPRVTDPAIDRWLDAHYVWLDPSAHSNGKLLVLFPGGNSTPADLKVIAREAAQLGYHVIALTYATSDPAKPGAFGVGRCSAEKTEPDPFRCQEKFRLELLDGVDRTVLAPVDEPNGIYNRLEKLLLVLARDHPSEGWSDFLENGAPRWSQIAVGGFSLGGGQAALIAKLHLVDRVVLLAAPLDGFAGAQAGTWTAGSWVTIGATPVERYFALAHERDPNFLSGAATANWAKLGLGTFGPPALQEQMNAPPFGAGTHTLRTNITPTGGTCPTPVTHRSVAEDRCTPVGADGVPVLRNAWTYLLTFPYDTRFDRP